MNKKILLAAMALPMLFTACSQDELIDAPMNGGMAAPEVRGFDVTLNPTLGAETRAIWDDTYAKLDWETTDLMSVYWLGNQATSEVALIGNFNSIFKTTDGNSFTSESLVFEGGNIAVFPGNTEFTKQGDIVLSVKAEQDASTIKKVPYISNYLQVSAVDKEGKNPNQTEQIAGYNNGLYAPMKLAANVLYLTLELDNTEDLAAYDFEVESVELVAKTAETTAENAFATASKLMVAQELPCDSNYVHIKNAKDSKSKADSVSTIIKQVYTTPSTLVSSLKSTAIESKGEGKYLVKFVILPTDNEKLNAYSEIVVNTNCGRLNLTTTKTIDKEVTLEAAYKAPEKDSKEVWSGLVSGKTTVNANKETVAVPQTIAEMLIEVVDNRTMETGAKSNFIGEKVGRPYARTIKGDMANATLNNSVVYDSEDILNYIAIHTAMKSTEKMNLVMSNTSNSSTVFGTLTAAAVKAIDDKNDYEEDKVLVTLSLGQNAKKASITGIEIADGGVVYAPNVKAFTASANLLLAADKAWTMNDVYTQTNIGKIINKGTLTIAGTTDKDGNLKTIAEEIENRGTIKLGSAKVQFNGSFINGLNGEVDIEDGKNFVFAESITDTTYIRGTIEIAKTGFLTLSPNVTVKSSATINNYGTIAAEAGTGGLINMTSQYLDAKDKAQDVVGTINIKDNGAITYLQDNEKGVVNLLARNNEVVVNANKGKIVYNYVYATDGATFKQIASDRFTYVVFGTDATAITLQGLDAKAGTLALNATSFEIKGTTTLTAAELDKLEIADLTVNAGANLKFLSGNTLKVANLYNNGTITIGGKISYVTDFENKGQVLSVGSGAIEKAK